MARHPAPSAQRPLDRLLPTAVKKLAEELMAEKATLILADDTRAMAAHAAEQGWIDKAALPEIGGDNRADEGTTGQREEV